MNRLRFFVIVHKRSAEKANSQRSIDKFEWIYYDNFEKESFPAADSPAEGRPPAKPTGRSAGNGTPRRRGGRACRTEATARPQKTDCRADVSGCRRKERPVPPSDGGRVKQSFPCPTTAERDIPSPARRRQSRTAFPLPNGAPCALPCSAAVRSSYIR